MSRDLITKVPCLHVTEKQVLNFKWASTTLIFFRTVDQTLAMMYLNFNGIVFFVTITTFIFKVRGGKNFIFSMSCYVMSCNVMSCFAKPAQTSAGP